MRAFCVSFGELAKKMKKLTSVNLNAVHVREQVKEVARQYMQGARATLGVGFDAELLTLDDHFQKLYQLAEAVNKVSSYEWRISAVRKALPKITARLEMQIGTGTGVASQTADESKIIDTLMGLVETAGLSYQQALRDLSDSERLTFRGPATDLRECLREVLDHLAPDSAVAKAPGFKLEEKQSKPTMKQKVRFILKAREVGDTSRETPEKAVETVEETIALLARSVHRLSSVSAHVVQERQTVVQLKRYVDSVLLHMLEL